MLYIDKFTRMLYMDSMRRLVDRKVKGVLWHVVHECEVLTEDAAQPRHYTNKDNTGACYICVTITMCSVGQGDSLNQAPEGCG